MAEDDPKYGDDEELGKTVGSYDAKTKLPELLRKVAQGQSFTVTNRGNAVAEIVPSYASESKRTQTAIDNLMKMPKVPTSDETLKSYRQDRRK